VSTAWTIQLASFVHLPTLAFLRIHLATAHLTTALVLAIAMCLETAEPVETMQAAFGATVAILAVLQ